MTPQEIKTETERLYKVIEDAQIELKNIRDKCNHVNTQEGTYSYRPGAFFEAIICSDCGKPLDRVEPFDVPMGYPSDVD